MTPSQQAAVKLALEALESARNALEWRPKEIATSDEVSAAIAAIRAELDRQDAPVIEHGFTNSPEKRRV